jgi:hypothetical protein
MGNQQQNVKKPIPEEKKIEKDQLENDPQYKKLQQIHADMRELEIKFAESHYAANKRADDGNIIWERVQQIHDKYYAKMKSDKEEEFNKIEEEFIKSIDFEKYLNDYTNVKNRYLIMNYKKGLFDIHPVFRFRVRIDIRHYVVQREAEKVCGKLTPWGLLNSKLPPEDKTYEFEGEDVIILKDRGDGKVNIGFLCKCEGNLIVECVERSKLIETVYNKIMGFQDMRFVDLGARLKIGKPILECTEKVEVLYGLTKQEENHLVPYLMCSNVAVWPNQIAVVKHYYLGIFSGTYSFDSKYDWYKNDKTGAFLCEDKELPDEYSNPKHYKKYMGRGGWCDLQKGYERNSFHDVSDGKSIMRYKKKQCRIISFDRFKSDLENYTIKVNDSLIVVNCSDKCNIERFYSKVVEEYDDCGHVEMQMSIEGSNEKPIKVKVNEFDIEVIRIKLREMRVNDPQEVEKRMAINAELIASQQTDIAPPSAPPPYPEEGQ